MTNSDNFKFLVGNNNFSKKSTQPYNKNICNFISDLSNELNKKALSKFYPDVKTFAFWCRKNNIYNLKKKIYHRGNKAWSRINFSYNTIKYTY